MQYLTYEEYMEIGGVLDLTAFNRNIDRACGMIDNHTQGRLKAFETVPAEVKPLCRDLVEYITANVVDKAVMSRSQSAGGVSESESYATKTADDFFFDVCQLMVDHLSQVKTATGVPILYRGAAS